LNLNVGKNGRWRDSIRRSGPSKSDLYLIKYCEWLSRIISKIDKNTDKQQIHKDSHCSFLSSEYKYSERNNCTWHDSTNAPSSRLSIELVPSKSEHHRILSHIFQGHLSSTFSKSDSTLDFSKIVNISQKSSRSSLKMITHHEWSQKLNDYNHYGQCSGDRRNYRMIERG
jgi:hypothetical protein